MKALSDIAARYRLRAYPLHAPDAVPDRNPTNLCVINTRFVTKNVIFSEVRRRTGSRAATPSPELIHRLCTGSREGRTCGEPSITRSGLHMPCETQLLVRDILSSARLRPGDARSGQPDTVTNRSLK